jgi:hypothetical protein
MIRALMIVLVSVALACCATLPCAAGHDKEIALITELIPKKQLLIKKPTLTKVANLNVDLVSYWLYTSDPMDNIKKREAIRQYGLTEGLQHLARRQFA